MRKPLIAGNWKMYKTWDEAQKLAKNIKAELNDVNDVDIVVCPPFTALAAVHEIIKDSDIALGAQNMHWENEGAYTGEISPVFLVDLGCKYVILGHSERRQHFRETDEEINRKIKAALAYGLTPILCVGETIYEREKGETENVVERELTNALSGLKYDDIKNIIIAYEPIWAIGTGKTATPEIAEAVHKFIRNFIEKNYSSEVASELRILYGGSIKPDNIRGLMEEPDIDGGLVGGASLKAESFVGIVRGARQL